MTGRTWRQADDLGGLEWQNQGFVAAVLPAPVRKWQWKVGRGDGGRVEWVLGGLVASREIALMAAEEAIDQLQAASQSIPSH